MGEGKIDRITLAEPRPASGNPVVRPNRTEEAISQPWGMLASEPECGREHPSFVLALIMIRGKGVVGKLREVHDGAIGTRKLHDGAVNPRWPAWST